MGSLVSSRLPLDSSDRWGGDGISDQVFSVSCILWLPNGSSIKCLKIAQEPGENVHIKPKKSSTIVRSWYARWNKNFTWTNFDRLHLFAKWTRLTCSLCFCNESSSENDFVIYLQIIVLTLKKAVAVRKSGSQIKGPLADAIRFLTFAKKSRSRTTHHYQTGFGPIQQSPWVVAILLPPKTLVSFGIEDGRNRTDSKSKISTILKPRNTDGYQGTHG